MMKHHAIVACVTLALVASDIQAELPKPDADGFMTLFNATT